MATGPISKNYFPMNKVVSPWLALVIVLTAPLLSVIDIFIINVAIPSIEAGIGANSAQVQLVIAGYLLGYASFLITGGRSGDNWHIIYNYEHTNRTPLWGRDRSYADSEADAGKQHEARD